MKYAPITSRLSALTYVLLAMLTVWSLSACNGKHKRSYDDEDEEEEEQEEVVNTSPLQIDEELLNSFDPDVPFEQTGHSRPFRIKPREDMTISAEAGAFERDVQIRVTDVPAETMDKLDGMLEDSGTTMLFAYDLDAGLPSDSVIPGKYTVSIDLDKHGIPEELYPYFMMYRVAGDGSLQPLNVRINGHTATYMASQNSITLAAVAISAVQIAAAVGIAMFAYAHYPAIFQTARHFYDIGIWPSNWWKWGDAVYEYVKDDYGNFYVAYRYSMTENGDKAQEYVKKKKELKNLVEAIRKEAIERYDSQHPQRFRGWFDSKEEEEKRRIGRETEFNKLLALSPRVQELKNDPVLQTPKSVDDIIEATKLANRYCRTVHHMKPLSYEYVTWLTPPLEAWKEEACRFQVPVFDPCIIVNYSNVVQNGQYKKDTYYKNLSTIAHETMHLYQMEYVVSSAFKDNCYLEATGALVEPYFTKWAIGLNIGMPITNAFSDEAARVMGYTERTHKELLSTPLEKKCPTYQGIKNTEIDRGYMLADLMQYLWDNQPNPRDTLDFAKMMNRYSYSKGTLKTFQDVFGIDGNPAFAKYYEGFCEKFIGDIYGQQSTYRGGNHRDNLVMPNLQHDPEHCVMRIKNLGEKCSTIGQPFMVNTFDILHTSRIGSNGRHVATPYNLFAMPSSKVQPSEVKFTFFDMNENKFPDESMYYVPKNNRYSRCYAAVMTRPNSKDLAMGNDYYFDIVALYQPDKTPEVKGSSLDKRGLIVKTKCTPSQELKENNYITGLQVVFENNKSGQMQSFVMKVNDWKDEFVAPYDKLDITDTANVDVSLRSRWYYESPQGKRYYSPATDIVNYRRQSDHVHQTIEQDTTQIETGTDIMGEDDEAPEKVNIALKVKSMGLGTIMDPMAMDYYNTTYLIRFVAENGRFTLTVPPLHVYKEDSFNHNTWNITQDWPGYTLTGNCNFHDVMYHGTNYRSVALDDNSFQISSSALHQSTIRNNCDDFGSYIMKSTSTEKWEFSLRKRQNVPRDDFKDSSIPLFLMFRNDSVEGNIYIPIHTKRKYKRICEEKTEEYEEEDDTWLYLEVKPFI